MGPLVAMQKVLLAVPRSFPKGFHYTEKNRLHILGETHVSIRKLLETGVWLVHVGQFLSLLDKKYVAGHQWDHYHPYEHQTKRALFFFFLSLETLSRHTTPCLYSVLALTYHPFVASCCFGKQHVPQAGTAEPAHTKKEQTRGTCRTPVVDTRRLSLQQGGKVGSPRRECMASIGEV